MNPAIEYIEIVEKIFILFKDCKSSFYDNLKSIAKMQETIITELAKKGPSLTKEELDDRAIHYMKKNPHNGKMDSILKTSQKEWKERLSENGANINFIGNTCLVLFYQFWEDHYREEIAKNKGFANKDEL